MKRKRRTLLVLSIAAVGTTYFACNETFTSAHKAEGVPAEAKVKRKASTMPSETSSEVLSSKEEVTITMKNSKSTYSTASTSETKVTVEGTSDEMRAAKKVVVEPAVAYDMVEMEESYAEGYEWGTEVDGYTSDDFKGEAEPVESISNNASAGVLTAGEINDFSKWELWQDITEAEFKQYSEAWKMTPENRVSVQVKSKEGKRVVDAIVKLKDKSGAVIWSAKTDNTGKAELWKGFFDGTSVAATLEVTAGGKTLHKQSPSDFHNGVNVIELQNSCDVSSNVDIAFMVDATGSMGDEINYLKAELTDIMGKLNAQHPELTLNLGSVFYRDQTDDYLTRVSALSSDVSQTTGFIAEQSAGGGGDYPEAVEEGLEKSVNALGWSEEARARILFVVLDAPPHQTKKEINKIKSALTKAAEMGIRIVPITASGIDKSTEFLMRSMALATNGTYVFLTDHSGVGNPHIEPTTDSYEVELLNDLMIRLINQYIEVPTCEVEVAEFYKEAIESDTLLIEVAIEDALIDTTNLEASTDEVTPVLPKVNSLKFYPNPTHGDINLEVEGEIKEIFLADMSGKLVKRFELEGTDKRMEQINIGEFPSGTYVLQYLTGEKWNAGKLLLLH